MTDERYDPVSDEELAVERVRLERLLSGMGVSLSEPSLWEEPVPLTDPLAEIPPRDAGPRWPRWWIGAAAAVAAVVVAVGMSLAAREPAADWEVALDATTDAPGASAVVQGWNSDGGTRLALSVTGLDPAPDGFVYELWFSNKDRHISAGTFAQAADIEMWVGIRRRDFPRVWITLEPLDADTSPAQTVLDTNA